MATTISESVTGRTARRRQATIDEALDYAEQIVAERGAGAVTIAEIARRMGMRPPSVYKYFPSLHGVYDALFARGNDRLAAFVDDAVRDLDPGLDRLLEHTGDDALVDAQPRLGVLAVLAAYPGLRAERQPLTPWPNSWSSVLAPIWPLPCAPASSHRGRHRRGLSPVHSHQRRTNHPAAGERARTPPTSPDSSPR